MPKVKIIRITNGSKHTAVEYTGMAISDPEHFSIDMRYYLNRYKGLRENIFIDLTVKEIPVDGGIEHCDQVENW